MSQPFQRPLLAITTTPIVVVHTPVLFWQLIGPVHSAVEKYTLHKKCGVYVYFLHTFVK